MNIGNMTKKIFLVIIFIVFTINILSQAYSVTTVPNPKSADANAFVSNPNGIISQATESELNSMLQELEAHNKSEVAVVVLNSIGNEDIFDFGVKLFEHWGIGKKKSDNGLLVLFVLDQRQVRFEVGYGLEGVLPDAICKRIQMDYMIPHFKSGDYDQGLLHGVSKTAEYIRGEVFDDEYLSLNKAFNFKLSNLILPILMFVIAMFFLADKQKKIKNDSLLKFNSERYSAMKTATNQINLLMILLSFFMPFIVAFTDLWSFLGGWSVVLTPLMAIPTNRIAKTMSNKFRRQVPACSKCGDKMTLLSEKNDDKYLTLSQVYEEKIKSVDYDVFLCDSCGLTVINEYKGKVDYRECPSCKTRDFVQTDSKIIKRPSYVHTGLKTIVFHCAFCGFQNEQSVVIPKLSNSSSSSWGGGSSGGSSSGSFGGGRSGGGGATSRW